jgi:hypothetical protein
MIIGNLVFTGATSMLLDEVVCLAATCQSMNSVST